MSALSQEGDHVMASRMWVRIDTAYLRNPKVVRAGRDAAVLHLASILYLGEHRIETGLLPPEALPFIVHDAGLRRPDPAIAALVKAGLWHPDALGGGYLVHDYGETNGEASASAAAKDRKRRWRERERDTDGPA